MKNKFKILLYNSRKIGNKMNDFLEIKYCRSQYNYSHKIVKFKNEVYDI